MSINWMTSFEEGLKKAQAEDKLLMVDFYNPN